jgi:hypothetical protein
MNSLNVPETRGKVVGGAVSTLSAAVGFVLIPKCPLCVAAYLTSFGIGATAATSAAPLVRWLALGLIFVASLALGLATRRASARRSARATPPACCRN